MFRFGKSYQQLSTDVTFYVLEEASITIEVTEVEYKHIPCPRCRLRAMARVGGTSVRFTREIEMTDFSGTANGLTARRSVFQHLTESRISGWRQGFLSVEATANLKQLDIDYYELVVIGHTRGYAEAVGLKIDKECELCGYVTYYYPKQNLKMPLECWDGSDIFIVDELPGLYIVTEATCNVIEQHHFTGIKLFPIAEWKHPDLRKRLPVRDK